jgi:hypothetical protein
MSDSYYHQNKDKLDSYRKTYKQQNPEKEKEWQAKSRLNRKDAIKNYRLKSRYGITLADVNRMLEEQGNSCKVCDTAFGKYVVDHCHSTGNVRGLLCYRCNNVLGQLNDDLYYIHKLKKYLTENP